MIGMRRFNGYAEALSALYPGSKWAIRNNNYNEIEWLDAEIPLPSKAELDAKVAELEADEPMRVVRDIRSWYLQQSDWTQGADIRALRGPEWCAAWDSYRQQLRDITSNCTPYFDEFDMIHGVSWPVKPSLS